MSKVEKVGRPERVLGVVLWSAFLLVLYAFGSPT